MVLLVAEAPLEGVDGLLKAVRGGPVKGVSARLGRALGFGVLAACLVEVALGVLDEKGCVLDNPRGAGLLGLEGVHDPLEVADVRGELKNALVELVDQKACDSDRAVLVLLEVHHLDLICVRAVALCGRLFDCDATDGVDQAGLDKPLDLALREAPRRHGCLVGQVGQHPLELLARLEVLVPPGGKVGQDGAGAHFDNGCLVDIPEALDRGKQPRDDRCHHRLDLGDREQLEQLDRDLDGALGRVRVEPKRVDRGQVDLAAVPGLAARLVPVEDDGELFGVLIKVCREVRPDQAEERLKGVGDVAAPTAGGLWRLGGVVRFRARARARDRVRFSLNLEERTGNLDPAVDVLRGLPLGLLREVAAEGGGLAESAVRGGVRGHRERARGRCGLIGGHYGGDRR